MQKKKLVLLLVFMVLITSYTAMATADWTWTNTSSFRIYESSSTTWGTGTLKCEVTLTDDNGGAAASCGSSLSTSTQYRVEAIIKNDGTTTQEFTISDGLISHIDVYGGWAGTNPTLGSCVFNDFGVDDSVITPPTCAVIKVGDNVTMNVSNDGTVNIASGGVEGFAYLITLDSDAASSAINYMYATSSMDSEDSNKISISIAAAAAVPEWSDYAILLIFITVVGGFFVIRKE